MQRPRLRVLFLSRLFAGLKQSLAAGRWEPAGVPAICRLIEGLHADPDAELLSVFTVKEPDPRFTAVRRQQVPGIGDTVILPYRSWIVPRLRRGNAALTELDSAVRILALAARFRPDVVYATYANILPAALLARAGHRGVVLRLMGVVPHHRDIAAGALPLFRWALRSPFAHVVCSEDGSDPAALLPKLLSRATPWTVRLNGCDAGALTENERQAFRTAKGLGGRPVVAFLGRLEPYKGSLEFIDAVLALLQAAPDCADVLLIGDGPLRVEMEARVALAGQSRRVHFTGSQPREMVNYYIGAADIYVSTNMYGNLSNANLEALAAGTCLVLPASDPALPLDTVTDGLIPESVAMRYRRDRLPDSLAETLSDLLRSPAEVAERRLRATALAKQLIKPWPQVVADDIALLKSIREKHAAAAVAPLVT